MKVSRKAAVGLLLVLAVLLVFGTQMSADVAYKTS